MSSIALEEEWCNCGTDWIAERFRCSVRCTWEFHAWYRWCCGLVASDRLPPILIRLFLEDERNVVKREKTAAIEYRTCPWSSIWCTVESAWHCEWEFCIRQWAVEEHLESAKRNVSQTSQTKFVFPLPTKNSSPRPTVPYEFSRWACHSYTDLIIFSNRHIFTETLMTEGKKTEENLRWRTERVKFSLTTLTRQWRSIILATVAHFLWGIKATFYCQITHFLNFTSVHLRWLISSNNLSVCTLDEEKFFSDHYLSMMCVPFFLSWWYFCQVRIKSNGIWAKKTYWGYNGGRWKMIHMSANRPLSTQTCLS